MQQHTSRHLRSPIERARFSEVIARVCYQLVVLDYRRNPEAYAAHVPTAILAIGDRLRMMEFGYLRFPLISLAVFIQQGGTLAAWRDEYPRIKGTRAPHKVRITRGPR